MSRLGPVAMGINALGNTAAGPLGRMYDQLGNKLFPNVLPDADTVFQLYLRGHINKLQLRGLATLNGVDLKKAPLAGSVFPWSGTRAEYGGTARNDYNSAWTQVLEMNVSLPEPGELLSLLNRDLVSDDAADQILIKRGWYHDGLREAFKRLRFVVPGASDLIRFSVREVWDPTVVKLYGYDDEFPDSFRYWAEKQGFGWDARTPDDVAKGTPAFTWANAYWRAHWQTISPGQAYEMFHRLRPSRLPRFLKTIPGVVAFGLNDVRTLLRVDDYPPAFRDRLTAIAYRTLTRVDVRRAFELEIITRDEVKEQALDRGLNDDDAETLTRLTEDAAKLRKWKAGYGFTARRVLAGYKAGWLTKGQAAALLYPVLQTSWQLIDDFNALDAGNREAFALADGLTSSQLTAADVDVQTRLAVQVEKAIRSRYFCGRLTKLEARDQVLAAGIAKPRADQLTDLWEIELSGRCKELSAAQIFKGLRYGYVSVAEGVARLTKLGYPNADRLVLLSLVDRDAKLDALRVAKEVARDAEAKKRAAKALIRELEAKLRKERSELARHGSPSQLAKWLRLGIIGLAEVMARFDKLGWPPADATRFLEEHKALPLPAPAGGV